MIRWRPCPGFEGFYRVSDQGDVESVPRIIVTGNGQRRRWGGQKRKSFNAGDEVRIQLFLSSNMVGIAVARLVLVAFKGEVHGKPFALHKDGDITNNRLRNLYWGTAADRNALAARERWAKRRAA